MGGRKGSYRRRGQTPQTSLTLAGGGAARFTGVVQGMPRKPRPVLGGGIYHVWARGIDRRDLFADDRDRRAYLAILNDTCEEHGWVRLAYCLMDNHIHLILETPLPNLSQGMRVLHSRYAQRFNLRHDRSGHVFQGRFGCSLIESNKQFIAVTRYVANNPVEAGLCSEPQQWAWTDTWQAEKRCGVRVNVKVV